MKNLNEMCRTCAVLGIECNGTEEKVYTGCACKKVHPKVRDRYDVFNSAAKDILAEELERQGKSFDTATMNVAARRFASAFRENETVIEVKQLLAQEIISAVLQEMNSHEETA